MAAPVDIRPGGRWHRILGAIKAAGAPLTIGDLVHRTSDAPARPRERRRIKDALRSMASQGLVTRGSGHGWSATAAGDLTLQLLSREDARG